MEMLVASESPDLKVAFWSSEMTGTAFCVSHLVNF